MTASGRKLSLWKIHSAAYCYVCFICFGEVCKQQKHQTSNLSGIPGLESSLIASAIIQTWDKTSLSLQTSVTPKLEANTASFPSPNQGTSSAHAVLSTFLELTPRVFLRCLQPGIAAPCTSPTTPHKMKVTLQPGCRTTEICEEANCTSSLPRGGKNNIQLSARGMLLKRANDHHVITLKEILQCLKSYKTPPRASPWTRILC